MRDTGRGIFLALLMAVLVIGCGKGGGGVVALKSETLLDGWEGVPPSSTLWEAWDKSQTAESTTAFFTEGAHGYILHYDLAKCTWPMVWRKTEFALDLTSVNYMVVDAYLPPGSPADISVYFALAGFGGTKHAAPPITLHEGWNTCITDLDGSWLDTDTRRSTVHVEMVVAAAVGHPNGLVVFDNLRTAKK